LLLAAAASGGGCGGGCGGSCGGFLLSLSISLSLSLSFSLSLSLVSLAHLAGLFGRPPVQKSFFGRLAMMHCSQNG
jgi:hypothetical protein